MKAIIFDTGPIISLALNNLLNILPALEKFFLFIAPDAPISTLIISLLILGFIYSILGRRYINIVLDNKKLRFIYLLHP